MCFFFPFVCFFLIVWIMFWFLVVAGGSRRGKKWSSLRPLLMAPWTSPRSCSAMEVRQRRSFSFFFSVYVFCGISGHSNDAGIQWAAAAGIAGNGNPRKRASEDVAGGVPTARAPQRHKSGRPINIFSGQPPPVSFDQLQIYSHPPAVISTGLGLSLDDQNHNLRRSSPNPVISSSSFSPFSVLLSEEFAAQINQQKDEIEQVLRVQVTRSSPVQSSSSSFYASLSKREKKSQLLYLIPFCRESNFAVDWQSTGRGTTGRC